MVRRPPPALAVVVPCYNEAAALPQTLAALTDVLDGMIARGVIAAESLIHVVDDGSIDGTWTEVVRLADTGTRVRCIKLARNYGHQHALLAGLLTVPGDAIVTIDADLQDDPGAMSEMAAAYAGGAEIVYGVRRTRDTDSWFKRFTGEMYYRLAGWFGVRLIFNHADYRLLSRRAVEALREYGERNVFLRGLIPHLGFSSATVYYDRRRRVAGESKYPLRKMWSFALEGILSFSAVPLKLITLIGLLVSFASFATVVWALWVKYVNHSAIPGWTSTVVPMALLGGIQLLCTGIIGQYLAKIYLETKGRPRYTIDRIL